MDPLCDYYLCTKDGETELVGAFLEDGSGLVGYDRVQELAYWQAVQWVVALEELQRSPAEAFDLFPLAAFMGASDEAIEKLFGDEGSR